MLKLSFRGFNDDYYEVCTTCYALTWIFIIKSFVITQLFLKSNHP